MMRAPDWAALLADDYAHFRELLVGVLTEMRIAADPQHIDCGVLHVAEGNSMGLTNLVRLCHQAPREEWRTIIVDHLRRSSARRAPMAFETAAPRLRVRFVPERLFVVKPEAYVSRQVAAELHLVIAIDNPEHVVFVSQSEMAAWGRSADELFALAEGNTRAEPAIEPHAVAIPDGPALTALLGESYFAASHALFIDRYAGAAERGHLVAVPDRHAVIALSLDEPRWMTALDALIRIANMRFTESPGAISDQLYWRRPEGELVAVRCGLRDDGTTWVAPPAAFNEMVAGS